MPYYLLGYSISSYSFRGNYSFLNLEIQRSQYKRPEVTQYINVWKLFKGGNFMRKYGICILVFFSFVILKQVKTEIFNLYVHSLFSYGVVNSTIWICTWQSKLRLIIAWSGIIWMLKKRDWTFWTRLMVCQWWVFWNVAKKKYSRD